MSKKLYPHIFLSTSKATGNPFSRFIIRPKILNWRLPDQTAPTADPLLNTDGETLLNTDGETLFNTGS